jgi:hypothetical protein
MRRSGIAEFDEESIPVLSYRQRMPLLVTDASGDALSPPSPDSEQ